MVKLSTLQHHVWHGSKQQGWLGPMEPHMAKRMRKVPPKRKTVASDGEKPTMAKERWVPGITNKQALFQCQAHLATPTVAASTQTNLAAVPVSQNTTLVWSCCLATWRGEQLQEGCPSGRLCRWGLWSAQEGGRHQPDQSPDARADQNWRHKQCLGGSHLFLPVLAPRLSTQLPHLGFFVLKICFRFMYMNVGMCKCAQRAEALD